MTIPRPPGRRDLDLEQMPEASGQAFEKLLRWAEDIQEAVERELATISREKVTPPLPIQIPTLPNAELAGIRFRAGGPPALVYVPDAPDGPAIGYRTGTEWLLVGPNTGPGGPGGPAFGVIRVDGQGDVIADSAQDILTLVAGQNVEILTDPTLDSVTLKVGPYVAHQLFDQINTSATPALLMDIALPVKAGINYAFRVMLVYSEDAAGDIELSLAVPSNDLMQAVKLTGQPVLPSTVS